MVLASLAAAARFDERAVDELVGGEAVVRPVRVAERDIGTFEVPAEEPQALDVVDAEIQLGKVVSVE
jgi:hypothetical protein